MGSLSTDSFFSRSLACANKPGSADFLAPVISCQVAVYARPTATTSAHFCVWIKRLRPRIPCAREGSFGRRCGAQWAATTSK